MAPITKTRSDLKKKVQKILKTPASYAFFVAIHDFVKYIESNPVLSDSLSRCIKTGQDMNIGTKYANLKLVHQGLEDVASGNEKGNDLGHKRYMAILDLNRIQRKDVSENNSFWKKRDLLRKSIVEIHEKLNPHFSLSKN